MDPIADNAVLIAGANRGVGRALVVEALRRGARRVYAGAAAVFDAFERGEHDIFPDPVSQSIAEGWHSDPAKGLERQYAQLLATHA